ncbi:nucleotidyltransferase domain-containing protein [candidate division KSB1 bacterium]|nr:nucleotidyltransferase domain-containing protein [candidate division KSB1 bacterium]
MKNFREWNDKSLKKSELIAKVEKKIRSIVHDADIILFGSRVRGTAEKYSDWDFLILIDRTLETALEDKIKDSLYEIELETNEIISSIIRQKEVWNSAKYSVLPFKRVVDQEGVLL